MGRLVVLDGLDGSGKSTQLDRLHTWLEDSGIPYRPICFPDYDQPSSALVKMYLAGEFGDKAGDVNAYAASSFYAVDRYASYKRFWQKDYEAGKTIVAARYTTSNAIHQMAKMPREQWADYLSWLEDYEYGKLGLPRPDAVLFLDMPLEIAQQLLSHRYQGHEERKDIHERDLTYLENCRRAALYAAETSGWQVISCGGNGHPFPPQEITAQLIQKLQQTLAQRV